MRSIVTGCRVNRPLGVFDGSGRARLLWHSHSGQTEMVFAEVVVSAYRLVSGTPWCFQGHPMLFPVLRGVPKLITITPIVLLYQSSEISVTLKASRNALLPSDPLLKLTHLSLHTTSCQTLLETPRDSQRLKYILLMHLADEAYTENCIIPRSTVSCCHPVSHLTSLISQLTLVYLTLYISIMHVNQWIESQLRLHLSLGYISRLLTSNYSSNFNQSWPSSQSPKSINHCVEVPTIKASKDISNVTVWWPPNLHYPVLQVYLQTHLNTASKCVSELLYLGLQMHYQTHLITAFKCITKLASLQPPSLSLRSLNFGLQGHFLVQLDPGLQVYLQTHLVTATKYIFQ
jgi:hypothetical protein